MPYLKTPDVPFIETRRLLLGYGFSGIKLADVLGCDPATARRRLKSPESLTLRELKLICRNGHVPADKIRESILFD